MAVLLMVITLSAYRLTRSGPDVLIWSHKTSRGRLERYIRRKTDAKVDTHATTTRPHLVPGFHTTSQAHSL